MSNMQWPFTWTVPSMQLPLVWPPSPSLPRSTSTAPPFPCSLTSLPIPWMQPCRSLCRLTQGRGCCESSFSPIHWVNPPFPLILILRVGHSASDQLQHLKILSASPLNPLHYPRIPAPFPKMVNSWIRCGPGIPLLLLPHKLHNLAPSSEGMPQFLNVLPILIYLLLHSRHLSPQHPCAFLSAEFEASSLVANYCLHVVSAPSAISVALFLGCLYQPRLAFFFGDQPSSDQLPNLVVGQSFPQFQNPPRTWCSHPLLPLRRTLFLPRESPLPLTASLTSKVQNPSFSRLNYAPSTKWRTTTPISLNKMQLTKPRLQSS